MTIEEALEKATTLIDEHLEQQMEKSKAMLKGHGATNKEVEAAISWSADESAKAKEECLVKLRKEIANA
jgi:hypothetical protein